MANIIEFGIPQFSFGSHVIFYLNDDGGILIVRGLHHSRDFVKHL